jgi:hypothetical protein
MVSRLAPSPIRTPNLTPEGIDSPLENVSTNEYEPGSALFDPGNDGIDKSSSLFV